MTDNREFLKDLLWFRSSFENRNPGPFAMVSIETWSFAMVLIRIATLIETQIETLVETSVPGLRTGFRSGLRSGFRSGFRFATLNRNLKVLKFATLGGFLWLRSGLRTGLRTGFRLQFRNPETFWNGGDDQVVTRVAKLQPYSIRNPETMVTTRF